MKATVVINVSMDTDNNQIKYDVSLKEGDCTGLNQLAQELIKPVEDALSLNNQTQRGKNSCQ